MLYGLDDPVVPLGGAEEGESSAARWVLHCSWGERTTPATLGGQWMATSELLEDIRELLGVLYYSATGIRRLSILRERLWRGFPQESHTALPFRGHSNCETALNNMQKIQRADISKGRLVQVFQLQDPAHPVWQAGTVTGEQATVNTISSRLTFV